MLNRPPALSVLLLLLLWLEAGLRASLFAADPTDATFRPHRIDDRIQNTACEIGPDGHLYVISMNVHGRTGAAELVRYLLDEHGHPLGEKQIIYRWQDQPGVQPIGLAFDPKASADRPVAWIALAESLQGHSGWSDPWAGRVYRAVLPNVASDQPAQLELKITNLPHGFHTVNNLHFGPDGMLYICSGSATTSGWEPHTQEQLLSGAILQADVARIDATVDVKTSDGGNYNPFAPQAPVRLFSTAIRQAYDCVWHPNGRLYACTNQNDVNGQTGAGGGVPNVVNVKPPEFLAIMEQGRTYGFPNAARGEFVLMGGNPTEGDDGWTEVTEYPVGVLPPATFDVSLLHRIDDIRGGSANGILCYRGSGPLHHRLICCFYNANVIYTFAVGDEGRVNQQDPLRGEDGQPIAIAHPLDICQHPRTGHLYVAAYGRQDKGEEGAVYFLERSMPSQQPALSGSPIALVDALTAGDTTWSGMVKVGAVTNGSVVASTSVHWLSVSPVPRSAENDPSQAFSVKITQPLPPGTHYGAVELKTLSGETQKVGVHIYVPDRDHEQWFAVSAGNAREVRVEQFPVKLPLDGTVMCAGDAAEIMQQWQLVAGPSDGIALQGADTADASAVFSKHGRYQFQFSAMHHGRTRQHSVTYLIDDTQNRPPQVSVMATPTRIAMDQQVELSATAKDDGHPTSIGQLSYRWSREGTGNGIAEFADDDAAATTVRFSRPGPYRLRCTVSDGVRESHQDVVIDVSASAP